MIKNMNMNNLEQGMARQKEMPRNPEERMLEISSEINEDGAAFVSGFEGIRGENEEFDALINKMIREADMIREEAETELKKWKLAA